MTNPELHEPTNVPAEIARILGLDPNATTSIEMEPEGHMLIITAKMIGYITDDSVSYRPLIELLKHYKVVTVDTEPFTS